MADKKRSEEEIRALVNEWRAATQAKQTERVLSFYTRDAQVFDARPPLAVSSTDAHRRLLQDWFDAYEGPIGLEFGETRIAAGEDVAFVRMLNHVSGKLKDGGRVDMWVRVTVGFQKVDAQWKATHEHVSVPFDPQTMRAALDLKP